MNKLLIALALIGCGNKKKDEPPPALPPAAGAGSVTAAGSGAATATGSGAATGSGSATAAGSAVDVPTSTDFEAKAKEDITDKNVAAKVQAIEKELGN